MCSFRAVVLSCVISVLVLHVETKSFTEIMNQAAQNQMAYLGTIEGKHFFAENPSTGMSWIDAMSCCGQSSMRMASITSTAQANLIMDGSKNYPNILAHSWTAGRDGTDLFAFVWDHDPTTPITSDLPYYHNNAGIHSCVALYHGDDVALQVYTCTIPLGCLCEVVA